TPVVSTIDPNRKGPDISFEVDHFVLSYYEGEPVRWLYIYTITNNGDSPAQDVAVNTQRPEGMKYRIDTRNCWTARCWPDVVQPGTSEPVVVHASADLSIDREVTHIVSWTDAINGESGTVTLTENIPSLPITTKLPYSRIELSAEAFRSLLTHVDSPGASGTVSQWQSDPEKQDYSGYPDLDDRQRRKGLVSSFSSSFTLTITSENWARLSINVYNSVDEMKAANPYNIPVDYQEKDWSTTPDFIQISLPQDTPPRFVPRVVFHRGSKRFWLSGPTTNTPTKREDIVALIRLAQLLDQGLARLSESLDCETPPHQVKSAGDIIFSSQENGSAEIYSVNADGGHQTRLTNNSVHDTDPAWSPDGTKIVFWSDEDLVGGYSL
ncbi:MAG: TolB family protein, partial [Dehalococcoidia bacterium]